MCHDVLSQADVAAICKSRGLPAQAAASHEKPRVAKTPIKLMRVTRVQLVCPNREFLDKLQRLLVEAKCPAEPDRGNLTLAYAKQYEPDVANALKTLKNEYHIEIAEVG